MNPWGRLLLFTGLAAFGAIAQPPPDALLVLWSEGVLFEAGRNGLVNELKDEFAITDLKVNEATKADDIQEKFAATRPRSVVLIGNNSIRLYAQYVDKNKTEAGTVPVVAILALDVKRAVSGLPKVRCIAYETPMVTALVSFRRVMNMPIETVGVIYRKVSAEFVAEHARYCQREKIVVKGILVGDDAAGHRKEIANALKQLVKKDRVQAFWVPNDNIILKPELLVGVWLPLFAAEKVPVIVGVESLVRPEMEFGTYAVIPDPVAMGEQAAGLVTDLRDDGWKCDGTIVYPAISMYSVLNMKKAVLITDEKGIHRNEVTKLLSEVKK
jgi:hypothetical protein